MSMLLATNNPTAAAAIGMEKRENFLPKIGTPVIYHPRIGERRAGRETFPAFVMAHMSEGGVDLDSVELLILYGAEDQSTARFIKPRSAENDQNCFECQVQPDRQIYADASVLGDFPAAGTGHVVRVATVFPDDSATIIGLRAEIEELRSLIIGSYEPMPKSIYDMLADLDAKIGKLVAPKRRGRPPAVK